MRALLDVNVLIALFDGSHVHHKQVTDWLVLLCQIILGLVIRAGKRVSSAKDGKLKAIHGAWIRFAL